MGFPGSSDGKVSAYNVEDLGSIPESGRSPGVGNGNSSSIRAWRIPWMTGVFIRERRAGHRPRGEGHVKME